MMGEGGVLIPSESFALVLKVFVMLINEVQATTEFWCIIYVNACLSLVDFIFSQKSVNFEFISDICCDSCIYVHITAKKEKCQGIPVLCTFLY